MKANRARWTKVLAFSISLLSLAAFAAKPLGTDVSGYQPSNIDWLHCKTNGVAFAYVKATEGTGYVNPNMVGQITGATSLGIPVGLYHYARPDLHPNITGSNSADSEAAYFWSKASPYIKTNGHYFVPMLDWEAPGVTNTSLNQTTLSQWVNEWCNTISNDAKAVGITMNVMVYSGTWYCAPGSSYNGGLNTTVTNWPNAMSGYPTTPNAQTGAPSTSPWPRFTVWQYADTNWSGGDSDVFNGTTNQMFQTLLVGPFITNDLVSVVTNVGSSATFTFGIANTSPPYHWYSNQVNIATTTNKTFTVSNVQPSSAGNYYVVVTNTLGTITSSTAYLSAIAPFTNAANANMMPTGFADLYPCESTCTDLLGTRTYGPNGNFTYANGKVGRGWKFNGSNTYLTNNASSLAVPWTLSLWVNRQNAPSLSAGLLSDGTRSIKLEQYNATRQVGMTVFGVGDYNFGYATPLNTWTHLVLVGTSTGTSLYANGTLVGSLTNSMPLPRSYFGADFLTGTGVLDYMSGTVDEVIIFNRALTTTEISTLYNGGTGALVRAPELTSAAVDPSATHFQLNMRGLTGKTFSIYRSSDCINWTFVTRLSSSSGTLVYSDPITTSTENYYKVFQP